MTIRPILTAPDPRLKVVSKSVDTVDAATRRLIDDMIESMYEADGIGLAAVQIGVPKRIIVMDLDQKDGKRNPRAGVYVSGASSDHSTPCRRCSVIVLPSLLMPPFA